MVQKIKQASWVTTVVGLVIGGLTFAQYMGYMDAQMVAAAMAALTAAGFIAAKDARK